MVGFSLCSAFLEVVTTSLVVVFAHVLNDPTSGQKYVAKLGVMETVSPARTIFYLALLFGGVYLIKNIISACEIFYQNFSVQKMSYAFKNKLLHRFAEMDYGFYLTRNSTYGSNIIDGDVTLAFTNGMLSLATIFSEFLVFLTLAGMVVWINPMLAGFILGVGGIIALVMQKVVFPSFYGWGKKFQEASVRASQHLYQFFHAFKEIVLLKKQEHFVEAFGRFSLEKSKLQAAQLGCNALPRLVIETLFVGLFVGVVSILCLQHQNPLQMMGVVGGYLYIGFRLMPGLNKIVGQLNQLKAAIPHIDRLYEEVQNPFLKGTYESIPNLRFQKSIVLKDVDFQYLTAKDPALSHIDLVIKKGECLGVAGETGSGKSTLINLILGLLKPMHGKVLIDGQYPAACHQWHKKIGYVPQAIYLTDDTIESNIAFGESTHRINQKKLKEVIQAAQLQPLIEKLPEGTKTLVGERGVRLSGGERQRIAIARALYHDPEVLVFDEATSALDHETEERVMETIRSVSKTRTVIMIAHRLTTLEGCDRVIRVDGGRVKMKKSIVK